VAWVRLRRTSLPRGRIAVPVPRADLRGGFTRSAHYQDQPAARDLSIETREKSHASSLAGIHSRVLYSGDMGDDNGSGGSWTLLTGHGHVLVEIARNPRARIRDISPAVGLTERTVQAIVADLEAAGYLTRTRVGRRTRYTVNPDSPFRHSAQEGLRVGPFLNQLTAMADADPPGPQTARHQRPGGNRDS
jgi:hypothetical protein